MTVQLLLLSHSKALGKEAAIECVSEHQRQESPTKRGPLGSLALARMGTKGGTGVLFHLFSWSTFLPAREI